MPKIRQIEVRDNINTVSPKLIGLVEIEGKKVPLMGVHFEDELKLKKWWKIHGTRRRLVKRCCSAMKWPCRLFKSTGDTLSINGRPVKIAGILDETGSQDDFLDL